MCWKQSAKSKLCQRDELWCGYCLGNLQHKQPCANVCTEGNGLNFYYQTIRHLQIYILSLILKEEKNSVCYCYSQFINIFRQSHTNGTCEETFSNSHSNILRVLLKHQQSVSGTNRSEWRTEHLHVRVFTWKFSSSNPYL